MSEASPLFDQDFLRRVESLKLVSKNLQASGLKGEHRVKQRGTGIEFADFRPYAPGDDIRSVDWPAYIRLDRLLVRQFEEEADLSVYLFLDSSLSMTAGDPGKFRIARQLTGALGYIGLYNLDRVTTLSYREGLGATLTELRGPNQAWKLFHFLENLESTGKTHVVKAVRDFFAARRRRGLVILVSDFLDEAWEDGLQQLGRLKNEVLAIQITSSTDTETDLPYETVLVDSESESRQRVRATPEFVRAYQQAVLDHRQEVAERCLKFGWSYLEATSTGDLETLLLEVFRQGHLVR